MSPPHGAFFPWTPCTLHVSELSSAVTRVNTGQLSIFPCQLRSLYWRVLVFFFYLLAIMDIHEDIFKWKVYLLLLTIDRESGLLGQS